MNSEFRIRSSWGMGLAGLILLTPFSLNHLAQGRVLLGAGTLVIVAILGSMFWIGQRGRYNPWLSFLGLSPAIVIAIVVALREQGVIGALWCYPATLLFYFTLTERRAWLANAALYVVAVPAAWYYLEPDVATRVAATLLGVGVFSAIFVRMIGSQQKALEARAVTDALTGLHNRATLSSTLEFAMEQARRSGIPMTLLALDLDEFKVINDRHGHDVGDRVLRSVAEILRVRIRKSDKAFRLGGEEFLAFLYATDEEQGRRVAEELRAAVQDRALIPDHAVTVSIGVASFSGDDDWEAWIRRCDQNLYGAKAQGRNLVVG